MASLTLSKLVKAYGNVKAVDGIDLEIGHGQLVCLLGPSGCGKTTTLRLVAGFVEPTEGEIRVGSRLVSSDRMSLPPESRNMSMIFQSYALWPHMTIEGNVGYGLKLRKLPAAEIKQRVGRILETIQMSHMAHRYPSELSGGQQQRVALARALVVEPETLLLDEPLSNLDANLREEMRFEIRRLHDEFKYTTLYVTHDQSEAMATADKIVVMDRGRIEQVGTPREIYEFPRTEFVAKFIGGTNVLRGKSVSRHSIKLDGFELFCNDHREVSTAEGEGAISIRMQNIELLNSRPEGTGSAVEARIARKIYVGAAFDYLVVTRGGDEIRVTAPSSSDFSVGDAVWANFPREHCLALG